MCGICGELSLDPDRPASRQAVEAMKAAIVHRGPDSDGTYIVREGYASLGFRRLAIIDLRATANQPMANEDETVHLVFNGEIYNFKELRQGLLARGHRFRSNADSEVILHLYEERGEEAVDALDGMFAFAVLDSRRQRLLLARDRAGKKPLFVYDDGRRLAFASEIRSLLRHPELALEPDPSVFPLYFTYGYVPHPATFYRHVRHVEPGTTLAIDRDGTRRERRYWQLRFPVSGGAAPVDRAEAAVRVRELVTNAVERRLMSDVPLGAFLSGGIDSTIVVGVMSQLMSQPVRTFSIGFAGDEAFDETPIARATAARLGAKHTEFRVTPSAIELLPTLVAHHDGPFADSSAIPTYLVAKLTREHVTVALNGDGGDEVFAGYLRFRAAVAAERVPALAASAASAAVAWLPPPRNERQWTARVRRFARYASLPLDDRLVAWAGVFYDDLDRLLGSAAAAADRHAHLRGSGTIDSRWSPLSRLLAANFHSYLHDDLLVKADRMSMANSLEARSPFLDTALIEYVAQLPDHYKVAGSRTKIILREAFADMLPDQVASRGKTGFGVPLDAWFRGELRGYLHEVLITPRAKAAAYVSQDYVRRLVEEHLSRQANHGHRLWTLLTFENWLEQLPSWRAGANMRASH